MKFIPQHDAMDCGPACLAMISSFYKKHFSLQFFRDSCYITKEGVSLMGLLEGADKVGFEGFSAKLSTETLINERESLPCILHWNQNHFVVLEKISQNILTKKYYFHISDPAHGVIKLNVESFKKSWCIDNFEGVGLFLMPTERLYEQNPQKEEKISVKYILNFLIPYKKQIFTMFILLLLGSLFTLTLPFLTQNLIDKGINAKNLNIIVLILLSQLLIFSGNLVFEVIRNWLMLHVGTKISISIISEFLKKLLQLPIKYFDTKLIGDYNQRIIDNERIENFLTSQSLLTFFSVISFSVFFGVLWYYDVKILITYLFLTIIAIVWSFYWLKKIKYLDYFKFQQRSESQESIFEIFNGVTEMKLNKFEAIKRNEWEKIQEKLFALNIRVLKLEQIQISGFEFVNQLKNILVTFLAATFVVHGKMTLGELLSVSYIVGQMNSPVNQLVTFFRSLQDAKLSLERLNEVQNHPAEEQDDNQKQISKDRGAGIDLRNVSFQYEGPSSPYVLENINMHIPEGKITAIVGASGSGKTTLMKLLLRFYDVTQGDIFYNKDNIQSISPKNLRENCGVVMQDGYIFSDTIQRNITTGDENINEETLRNAIKIANIEEFIDSLPLGLNTKIGASGSGLSGGQKQRILIARAVYKNPYYIFFDEATSALDAENEKIIHDNLQEFFNGKTVVIIAHRLSTVKNADQIIVLKNGKIVENGNHQKLVNNKSDYFNLVKNQLELGN
ncbi:peptidase domain-containing ABC transporter [Chryseobacterium sp.]|uniref:peptidase domain-containing ABC transporter n=1 Tax=Chryseobacterium sp. TaxID=1871047 RepID=UPI00321A551B